jgi:hypothetical protein
MTSIEDLIEFNDSLIHFNDLKIVLDISPTQVFVYRLRILRLFL